MAILKSSMDWLMGQPRQGERKLPSLADILRASGASESEVLAAQDEAQAGVGRQSRSGQPSGDYYTQPSDTGQYPNVEQAGWNTFNNSADATDKLLLLAGAPGLAKGAMEIPGALKQGAGSVLDALGGRELNAFGGNRQRGALGGGGRAAEFKASQAAAARDAALGGATPEASALGARAEEIANRPAVPGRLVQGGGRPINQPAWQQVLEPEEPALLPKAKLKIAGGELPNRITPDPKEPLPDYLKEIFGGQKPGASIFDQQSAARRIGKVDDVAEAAKDSLAQTFHGAGDDQHVLNYLAQSGKSAPRAGEYWGRNEITDALKLGGTMAGGAAGANYLGRKMDQSNADNAAYRAEVRAAQEQAFPSEQAQVTPPQQQRQTVQNTPDGVQMPSYPEEQGGQMMPTLADLGIDETDLHSLAVPEYQGEEAQPLAEAPMPTQRDLRGRRDTSAQRDDIAGLLAGRTKRIEDAQKAPEDKRGIFGKLMSSLGAAGAGYHGDYDAARRFNPTYESPQEKRQRVQDAEQLTPEEQFQLGLVSGDINRDENFNQLLDTREATGQLGDRERMDYAEKLRTASRPDAREYLDPQANAILEMAKAGLLDAETANKLLAPYGLGGIDQAGVDAKRQGPKGNEFMDMLVEEMMLNSQTLDPQVRARLRERRAGAGAAGAAPAAGGRKPLDTNY